MAGELPFEWNDRWRELGPALLSGNPQRIVQVLELLEQRDRQLEDYLAKLGNGGGGTSNNFVEFWNASGGSVIDSPLLAHLMPGDFSKGAVYYPLAVPSEGFHLEAPVLNDGGGTGTGSFYFALASIGPIVIELSDGIGTKFADYSAYSLYIHDNDMYVLDPAFSVLESADISAFRTGGGDTMNITVSYAAGALSFRMTTNAGTGGDVTLSHAVALPPSVYVAFVGETASSDDTFSVTGLNNLSF